jgi:hypothetical protein
VDLMQQGRPGSGHQLTSARPKAEPWSCHRQ